MDNATAHNLFKKGIGLILIAAIAVIGLWFLSQTISIVILFFLTIVLTLILNAPTMWLVEKGMKRTLAALLVFFLLLVLLGFLGWLVIPKMLEQVTTLITNLPAYIGGLQEQLARQLGDYPGLRDKVLDNEFLQDNLPSVRRVAAGVYNLSFSLIGGIFLGILFLSLVVYMLINPAPLVETYLTLFAKAKRTKAAKALAHASKMMVGWMWSNLVVGSMEAVAVFFFLTYMEVPGVWVWTGLAFFAEMVPKLGLYIMAVPPVLIALSIDPIMALWVLLFYLLLNEIMGDLVMPRIRASTMNLHPISSLLVMLLMVSAFGIMGALIATPLTAFIKAYYEAFYLNEVDTEGLDTQVNVVLKRKV